MTQRTIHAIEIKLRSADCLSVIIWPFEKREFCLRLINSKRTWMTARAGDAVLLKREKSTEWERHFIESIRLFLANPVEFNGTIIETAQSWIDGSD